MAGSVSVPRPATATRGGAAASSCPMGHALYARGTCIATIARQLGISRPTVYAYLRRGTLPAPRSPQRSGQVLRPYMPYLIRRWREGITDSMQLWREIQAQGHVRSARTVCRFI